MVIEPADIERLQRQLNRAGVEAFPTCPICHGQAWRTNAALRLPVADQDVSAAAFEVMCATCGYILLFAQMPEASPTQPRHQP